MIPRRCANTSADLSRRRRTRSERRPGQKSGSTPPSRARNSSCFVGQDTLFISASTAIRKSAKIGTLTHFDTTPHTPIANSKPGIRKRSPRFTASRPRATPSGPKPFGLPQVRRRVEFYCALCSNHTGEHQFAVDDRRFDAGGWPNRLDGLRHLRRLLARSKRNHGAARGRPVTLIFASASICPALVVQVTRAGRAVTIGSKPTSTSLSLNKPSAIVKRQRGKGDLPSDPALARLVDADVY